MDKKSQASSSSQGDSRFHIGTYDAAAWRRDNYGKGGGLDMHKDPSKFDRCYNYPYTGMSDTKTEKAQNSCQKDS
ncbi:hypothetical protein GOY07_02415 [Wolbachia endosymbiont of Litomosoides sigmodontis]|uniref:hypothetical protein n=1 Tax=Wolbachia endosymbiont of Litomosoides sigmodontis TaxID=80850 RepID=UPI00158E7F8C|nr:hypothetical protein [Wolbachia endosymbiont of Litomosoides sigmodontis]QKX03046.1 hypothetical protein GOY07_02415 [Wolbachia endosymbiont of Litomosoides sigmodontis]